MAIPSTMADLSTTANSNSPSGSENPGQGDDFLRAIQAILRTTNAKGSDIASATTTDIGAATGEFVDVTGTTTITGLGTIASGIRRVVRFTGILILTHNGTSLILPSSANITTQAGDIAQFRSLGSGNWVCTDYIRKDGTPLALTDASVTTAKIADGAINGFTAVTLASNDYLAIADTSDSGNKKKALVSDLSSIISATGRLLGTVYYTTPSQALTSISNANPAVFTVTNARLLPQNFSPVQFTTSGNLPTGLSLATTYYTFNASGTTFNVATSMANAIAGTAVATTGAGSGTHTMAAAPYVKATGVFGVATTLEIEVQGAGGGSGGSNNVAGSIAVGGGAGAWGYRRLLTSALGASETLTVGDGGTAGANTGTNGGTGGTSSFGSFVSCTGGAGGTGSTANASKASAAGGAATGGDMNQAGAASFGVYGTSVQLAALGGLGHMNAGNDAIPIMSATYAPANGPKNSGNGANGAMGNGTAQAGGIGGSGYIIVREYS